MTLEPEKSRLEERLVPEGSDPISLPTRVSSFEATRRFGVAGIASANGFLHGGRRIPSRLASTRTNPKQRDSRRWDWGADVVSDFSSPSESEGSIQIVFKKSRNPDSTEPSESHHSVGAPFGERIEEDYRR